MISVIIPTYNTAQYVGEAIKSVCHQTYRDVEILVIDDGSTDNTEEVVRAIEDRRVRYIKTPNRGNYFARNRGLEEARGDYIAFLDADDVFLPQKLEKQLRKFQENPELGLCCSNFYVRFQGQEDAFADSSYSFDCDFDTGNGFIERAIDNNFMLTSTLMIRKECVERLGLFDTRFQNAMDYEFCLRIIFNYPACYMSERLIVRLEHSANISKNKLNTYKALLYIFDDCFSRLFTGALYRLGHTGLIRRKKQKSMYYLGLEYLMMRDYRQAYRYLRESRYTHKRAFRAFAMAVARLRLGLPVVLISSYRWRRHQQQIFSVKGL